MLLDFVHRTVIQLQRKSISNNPDYPLGFIMKDDWMTVSCGDAFYKFNKYTIEEEAPLVLDVQNNTLSTSTPST